VTAFTIPVPYREPLTTLANMPAPQADHLIKAISTLEPFAPVSMIQDAVDRVLGESATPGDKQLAFPFLALRGQLRQTSSELIADRLSQSLDLELDETTRATLRSRAVAILGTSVLSTTAVATDLQTQNGCNYQSARIVTDLRPVFPDHVEDEPVGAVIVETLQIHTWTRDGNSDLIFVSMDEADLKQLKTIVDRALKKTETLKGFIAAKGLAYFELEKEPIEG
jgi:hypothetical protein